MVSSLGLTFCTVFVSCPAGNTKLRKTERVNNSDGNRSDTGTNVVGKGDLTKHNAFWAAR